MSSAGGVQTSLWTGCPIRSLRARRSHAAPPERFAGLRVLLRPSAPRHPPRPLSRLCSPGASVVFARLRSCLVLLAHVPFLLALHATRRSRSTLSRSSACLVRSLFLPWQY